MLRILAITLGLSFLAGCDMVTIDKPIGEPFTNKEKTSLVGSWVTEDDVSEVRKTKHGDMIVGALNWDEKEEKFRTESTELSLTTIGQSKYLFTKYEEGYLFCRYVRKDDANVELTIPDPKAFRKVVEEAIAAAKDDPSKAIGRVVGDSPNFLVKLSSESKALKEFFESPKIDACFDKEAILKYKRIQK